MGWDPADWQVSAAAVAVHSGSPVIQKAALAMPEKPSIAVLPFRIQRLEFHLLELEILNGSLFGVATVMRILKKRFAWQDGRSE